MTTAEARLRLRRASGLLLRHGLGLGRVGGIAPDMPDPLAARVVARIRLVAAVARLNGVKIYLLDNSPGLKVKLWFSATVR